MENGWKYRKLDRTHKDGTAYFREGDVEEEIRRLHAFPDSARRRELLDDSRRATGRRFREETIVYAIRQYHASGDWDAVQALTELLCERIAGRIQRLAKNYHLPEASWEDVHMDLLIWLCEAVRSDSSSNSFAEVRFWRWISRRATALFKAMATQDSEASLESELEYGDEPSESPLNRVMSDGFGPELLAVASDLLSSLRLDDQALLRAKYVDLIPETSRDKNELTLAKMFGLTDRAIRYRLRRIEEHLAAGGVR
jgi:hypothetical protein